MYKALKAVLYYGNLSESPLSISGMNTISDVWGLLYPKIVFIENHASIGKSLF
jgi:hypothetical protein